MHPTEKQFKDTVARHQPSASEYSSKQFHQDTSLQAIRSALMFLRKTQMTTDEYAALCTCINRWNSSVWGLKPTWQCYRGIGAANWIAIWR
jgi:hypothetical protein